MYKWFFLSAVMSITFQGLCQAQDAGWQPLTRELVISAGDSVVRLRILINQENIKPDINTMYYWHNKGQINKNQGDFAGELVQGEYLVYGKQKNLITKGYFEKGVATGTWKRWYSSGKLRAIENYSKGLPDGEFIFYNEDGTVKEEVKYRNGELLEKTNRNFRITKEKSDTNTLVTDSIPSNISDFNNTQQ